MATVLPSVDFGFEDLKDQMSRFTLRFDEFIEKGRKRILEEKNEFARNIAEDKDTQRMLNNDLEYYKTKEKAVAENIEKEEQEAQEAEHAIADMARKRQMKVEYKEQLMAQIEETRQAIEKKRAIRAAERKALSSQASKNTPELAFWEDYLGMRIEGAGVADHLKIVYTHLLDSDWSKEFSFVVNMVTRDYEVVQCQPNIGKEGLINVVDKLNETRDFSTFLKEMRQLFKEVAGE